MSQRTFQLLWCERCGHADDELRPARLPDFALASGPLVCTSCNEPLTLLDCQVATGGLRDRSSGRWTWSPQDLATVR
jgi:hypothetical protein